eukprot:TRINITY_DN1410_c0_g1_i10.p6 TRINITY_DN1410_c0_g1~~TRINITY_DN1410_c0_g1_i10.p6  ORF type:complete len:107 (-),score=25.48 TRINITY_DN1410_c0_g1_i10:232-552(-)
MPCGHLRRHACGTEVLLGEHPPTAYGGGDPQHPDSTSGATKMRHLDLREKWVRMIQDNDKIKLEHIDGKHNPADFGTKLFSAAEFREKKSVFLRCDEDEGRPSTVD